MDRFASTRRRDPFSLPAKDQAVLDSLVEASLAEAWTAPSTPDGVQGDAHDPATRFLASSAALEGAEDFTGADYGEDELDLLVEQSLEKPVGAAPWVKGIDPFPAKPAVTFRIDDDRMKKVFAPVAVSTANHLGAAVVDLTGNPAAPAYAGLNDRDMIFAGSLLKICAMYAAFALRSRVQACVDAAPKGAPVVPPLQAWSTQADRTRIMDQRKLWKATDRLSAVSTYETDGAG